jgi:hypothetical protein
VRVKMFGFALVAALVTLACGSSSPTTPTSTYVAPLASPNLVQSGGNDFGTVCFGSYTPIGCYFNTAIKNTGSGCARNTSVSVQFYDEAGNTMGAAHGMGVVGGTLSGLTIRPGQVVAIRSMTRVPGHIVEAPGTFRLSISQDTVAC